MSPQRLRQLERQANGTCIYCNRVPSKWSKSMCEYHLDQQRMRYRPKYHRNVLARDGGKQVGVV